MKENNERINTILLQKDNYPSINTLEIMLIKPRFDLMRNYNTPIQMNH